MYSLTVNFIPKALLNKAVFAEFLLCAQYARRVTQYGPGFFKLLFYNRWLKMVLCFNNSPRIFKICIENGRKHDEKP